MLILQNQKEEDQENAAHYGISSSPLSGVPPMNGRRPAVV